MQGESLLALSGQPAQPPQGRQPAAQGPQSRQPPQGRLKAPPTYEKDSGVGAGFSRPDERPVYAETNYPRQAFGWSGLLSWRAENFLYVRAPKREVYDLRTDAQAATNIFATQSAVAIRLDRELDLFLRHSVGGSGSAAPVDPSVARRLASLGYIAGASNMGGSTIDPKDRIQIANTLRTAIAAVEDGAFQKAVPLLERVTASEPTIPIAQLNLGIARARQRQYTPAIESLQKAITLDPQSLLAQYELASAYYESGDLKSAASHFGIVASRLPKWADARYSLGSVYARIDRVDEAVAELRAALGLEPQHFRANLLLGRILTLRNQGAAALPFLQTAASVQPSDAETQRFLADAYDKVGNAAEAAKARRRAEELGRK
jgi:choline-sulfatase